MGGGCGIIARMSHRQDPNKSEFSCDQLSALAAQPGFALLRDGSSWRLYSEPREILTADDGPCLAESLRRIEEHVTRGGEAAGLLRYEAGYALEPRLNPLLGRNSEALSWFGLYDKCTVLDRDPIPAREDCVQIEKLRLAITRDRYCEKIEEIRDLIAAGEVYQVNFTTRVEFETACSAWELFCRLVRSHPVPYAAFLNLGDQQIVSLSPELFFEVKARRITVKPMKGTAPRGRTLAEDIAAGERLRADAKNRAENVMIVDLMRNDLGRICRTGTVETPRLFHVERYPSVWQMTSTVRGELREDCSVESIVRALFPSGSVTGAPKIRAMEHIAALEDAARGAYTGAIGFFAPQRSVFNVAIRTAVMRGCSAMAGIGGGITYGSSALAEWEECHWKAAFLTHSEPEFRLLETMLWDREYHLLQSHLTRMRESAEYFGFRFHETEMRNALQNLAAGFGKTPQRVRITLGRDGGIEIEHRDYAREQFGRVRLSPLQMLSTNRFLFHKTTNRRVYDEEFRAARAAKCDDALFFNERSELTEGAAHNVFVVKDGIWRTPPVTCGLLAGVQRAQVLRENPNAMEALLTLDDLFDADEIYLCNSVRGFHRVELVHEDAPVRSSTELDLAQPSRKIISAK